MVAAPALLLGVGGLVWMVKRNRKQHRQLTQKLNEADAEIAATQRGFEAFVEILPRATETLNYIAVQHSTSGGRDGQANALRALHKCVVKSGNCGVMPLGGVQHAAIGQLETSRCAQLTEAVGGVGW